MAFFSISSDTYNNSSEILPGSDGGDPVNVTVSGDANTTGRNYNLISGKVGLGVGKGPADDPTGDDPTLSFSRPVNEMIMTIEKTNGYIDPVTGAYVLFPGSSADGEEYSIYINGVRLTSEQLQTAISSGGASAASNGWEINSAGNIIKPNNAGKDSSVLVFRNFPDGISSIQIDTKHLGSSSPQNHVSVSVVDFSVDTSPFAPGVPENTGTPEDDLLKGTNEDDTIVGYDGNDTIKGKDGDDLIDAGGGNDLVKGGSGNDSLSGNFGDDTLFGQAGDDSLFGGNGNDLIKGGSGNDSLSGNLGEDTLLGGHGNDLLRGGNGEDSLNGGRGSDSLDGEEGNDTLWGGRGNDLLRGGDGEDSLNGGRESDSLDGEEGNDTLKGGKGDDILFGGDGADVLMGGDGNDSLIGDPDDYEFFGYDDVLKGGKGNDTLDGGVGSDTLIGGDGNDYLIGDIDLDYAGFNDVLKGGKGDDTLDGAAGRDVLIGGDGNDFFFVSEGDDTLRLGSGEDEIAFESLGPYYYDYFSHDIVEDFNVNEDTLLLRGFGINETQTASDFLYENAMIKGQDLVIDSPGELRSVTLKGIVKGDYKDAQVEDFANIITPQHYDKASGTFVDTPNNIPEEQNSIDLGDGMSLPLINIEEFAGSSAEDPPEDDLEYAFLI